MMPTEPGVEKAQSRQDQILLLAAEGMTDKEIAARLTLSPETVGTYWRRILGKYSAASRTEVVAKVVRLQAEETVSEIAEVNECLKEVTDHLLLVMSGRDFEDGLEPPNSLEHEMLASLPGVVAAVDAEGYVLHLSRAGHGLSVGATLESAFSDGDRDALRDAFGKAMDQATPTTLEVGLGGRRVAARITPARSLAGPIAVVHLDA